MTTVLAPNALMVAARVDLDDDVEADRIERASTEIERDLREAVPDVTEVFLDATPGPREEQAITAGRSTRELTFSRLEPTATIEEDP